MSEWQDISTAPRDGTPILLLNGHSVPDTPHVLVGSYLSGEHAEELGYREFAKYGGWLHWHQDAEFYVIDIDEPSYWMPLPKPPEAET